MDNEFEILGKVKEVIGKKGYLEFIDTNLAGTKRVMVTMVPEKGEAIDCLLSADLSAKLRAKEITVGNLVTFSYGVNELGRHYICRPQGNKVKVLAKDIVAEEIEAVEFDLEDYITL